MSVRETYVYRNGKIIPKHLAGPRYEASASPVVISDLPEYRTAAADKATGKRMIIGGRRQHREFLRRNNYEEVGNEYVPPRREELSRDDRINDLRRALGDR